MEQSQLAPYNHSMADEPIDLTRERFNRVDAKLDRILDAIESLTLRVGSLERKTDAAASNVSSGNCCSFATHPGFHPFGKGSYRICGAVRRAGLRQ